MIILVQSVLGSCARCPQTISNDVGFTPALSLELINEYLAKQSPGKLDEVCIMRSKNRDGYYLIVDYSGRDKEVLYYESSKGLEKTGIGGLKSVFSFREVSLSQGEYLEVFAAGSMGTGYFYLYKNDSTYDVAYSLEDKYVIDVNMDAITYGELPELVSGKLDIAEGYITSWVINNGRLEVEYDDYNADSHTDIRFYGIRQTIVTKDDHDAKTTVAEDIYVCTYLFNPELDDFVFDQELFIPL